MKRHLVLLILLSFPVSLLGCGDQNDAAPPDNAAHATDWIKNHPEAALATADFGDCIACHGADLSGSGEAVSCYSCHAFTTTPPFTIHPEDEWTNGAYADHRSYAGVNGTTTCVKCHGADLHGSPAAPSCFSVSTDSGSCHVDGPGVAPHTLDGTFLGGSVHGPVAKADLTVCQGCHGEAGGPGSNPRFNLGIDTAGGAGCESCHDANGAHLVPWPALSHSSAGNIAGACTLCHGVALDGVGGVGTLNCLNCHGSSPAANPTGCASCHNQPPDGAAPVGDLSPNRQGRHNRNGHTAWISDTPALTCVRCHDGAGSGTDNHFDAVNPADISFQHPDPSDTISAVSDGANTTCNGACHVTNGADIIYPHTDKTWY
jgi:hypothetical protein